MNVAVEVLKRFGVPLLIVLVVAYACIAIYGKGVARGTADANARWQKDWDEHLLADERAAAQFQAEQRAEEQRRQHSINKVTQDAQQAIDQAVADAADAAARAGSLQRAADSLAARLADSQDRVSSCTLASSQAAAAHARVLADVFKRADARAGHLAGVADQAIERGLACERSYDALTKKTE